MKKVDTMRPDDRLDLEESFLEEAAMVCTYASLSEEKLKEIRELEASLGKALLAFSCKDVQIAELGDEELKKVKELEEKLGVPLVAVRK